MNLPKSLMRPGQCSLVPAGVTDTVISALVLFFLLYAWFGNQAIQV